MKCIPNLDCNHIYQFFSPEKLESKIKLYYLVLFNNIGITHQILYCKSKIAIYCYRKNHFLHFHINENIVLLKAFFLLNFIKEIKNFILQKEIIFDDNGQKILMKYIMLIKFRHRKRRSAFLPGLLKSIELLLAKHRIFYFFFNFKILN